MEHTPTAVTLHHLCCVNFLFLLQLTIIDFESRFFNCKSVTSYLAILRSTLIDLSQFMNKVVK